KRRISEFHTMEAGSRKRLPTFLSTENTGCGADTLVRGSISLQLLVAKNSRAWAPAPHQNFSATPTAGRKSYSAQHTQEDSWTRSTSPTNSAAFPSRGSRTLPGN